jgi:hypothetical protein
MLTSRHRKKSGTRRKKLQAFLSYSTKDRALAGRLKRELGYLAGLKVFLAPRDLKPSREHWRNRIIRSVKECDPFLALLTNHYRKSEWTDQESGMAMASGKLIIPLRVGTSRPYGFLESYQYQEFKASPTSFRKSCSNILKAVKLDKKLRNGVQQSFIQCLNASGSFKESEDRSELLDVLGPYSTEQINGLFEGYLRNHNIHHGFAIWRKVIELLIQNKKTLRANLIRQAKKIPQSQISQYLGLDELLGHI